MNVKAPDPGLISSPRDRQYRSVAVLPRIRPPLWSILVCSALALSSWATPAPAIPAHNPVGEMPPDAVTQDVLSSLLTTPLGRTMPRLEYSVNQAQTLVPNAFSYPDGKLYVTLGTNYLLGNQRGLWAGLLSHELGHVLQHHPEFLPAFEREMQNAYLQSRLGRREQPQVNASAVATTATWLNAELDRHGRHEEEFEADIIGLMLMAEAGYHPQFFLILGRDLNFYLRTSRVTSFFVRHPDWGSREKRLLEVYDAALAVFNSRWPDIAGSPGGKLPALGAIGKIGLNNEGKAVLFQVPFRLTNPDHKPVRVVLTLFENKRRIPSTMREYRSADGFLVVNSELPAATDGPGSVALRLPVAAVGTRIRNLKAVVFLATGELPIAMSQFRLDLPAD